MSFDIQWCEICDGHHGPGQHPTSAESAIATRNAELSAELAEANNRWHSACDVGRRLEVRNAQLIGELAHMLELFAKQRESLQRYKAATKQARALIEEMTNSDEPRSYLGAYEGLRALIGGLP